MEKGLTLYELTAQMAQIEDELMENGGELTPELKAAMTETKESLALKVDNYNALYRNLGASAEALKSEIERLTRLKRTAENAQARVKDRLLWNMRLFGIDKLKGNLCSVSIRKSTSLKVDEEAMLKPYSERISQLQGVLPPYITVDVKISKSGIKEMYKGTDALPAGCENVENESLTIR